MSVDGDLVAQSTTNMPRERIIKRHFKFKQKSFKENSQDGNRSMSALRLHPKHTSNSIAKMSLQNDTSFYLSECKSEQFWKPKQSKQRRQKRRNEDEEVFYGIRYNNPIIYKASLKSSIFNDELPTTISFSCDETNSISFHDNLYSSFDRTTLWKKNKSRSQKEEKEMFMVYSLFDNSYLVTCHTFGANTGIKSGNGSDACTKISSFPRRKTEGQAKRAYNKFQRYLSERTVQ
jgi:hypothetical protein